VTGFQSEAGFIRDPEPDRAVSKIRPVLLENLECLTGELMPEFVTLTLTTVGMARPNDFQPRPELSHPTTHGAHGAMDLETLGDPIPGLFSGPETSFRKLLAKLIPSPLVQSGFGAGLGLGSSAEPVNTSLAVEVKPSLDRRPTSTDTFTDLTETEFSFESVAHRQQPFPGQARGFLLESLLDSVRLAQSIEFRTWSSHPQMMTDPISYTRQTCALV